MLLAILWFITYSTSDALQLMNQNSNIVYTQFQVTNDMITSNLTIELSSKSSSVPLILLVKKEGKPNFYYDIPSDTYFIDADYVDFQAWIQNSANSFITIHQSDLSVGSIYYIGIYSEIWDVSYYISIYPKLNSVCLPGCVSANYSSCEGGSCSCGEKYSGNDCSILYNITEIDENSTFSLSPSEWKFFAFSISDSYGFTTTLEKLSGDPKFYFYPYWADPYLPSMFYNLFSASFEKTKTHLSVDYDNSHWDLWTYSVNCRGEANCEFAIKITTYSDSSGKNLIWIIVVVVVVVFVVCVLIPIAIRTMIKFRSERLAQMLYDRPANPLTPEEMEKLYPSVAWCSLEREKETCSVCLEEFEGEAKVRKLICEHIFHVKCIDEWTQTNAKCPLCKKVLNGENQDEDISTSSRNPAQPEIQREEENKENEENKEAEEEREESETERRKRKKEKRKRRKREKESERNEELNGIEEFKESTREDNNAEESEVRKRHKKNKGQKIESKEDKSFN
ncbi:unnamed protein product [Blepharisma stoltei]|uniref:RING-type domain-containing protein n=1 Tax=Blepharisma stoltei TaxID=1481888 RepID=A0AAU9JLB2_9CILI|nr:unnamed protein product [Blepharisma stoltei]